MDPRLTSWRLRVFVATWAAYACYYFTRKPFFICKHALGEAFGWNATQLGDIGMCYLVAYAVGQFVAGAMGNRWGPRVLLLGGMAVSVVANAAFGFANTWGTFAAFMVLNGLAQATGWAGGVGSMAPWFRREERGRVMALWATNFQAGGVLANALASWALGLYGYRWSFLTGSVVLLFAWGNVLWNQRNRPEDVGLPPVIDREDVPGASSGDDGRWPAQVVVNVVLMGVFYFFVKFIRYALWSWAPYLLEETYGLAGDRAGFLSTAFDLAGIAGVLTIGFLSDRLFGGRRARVSFYFILGMVGSTVFLYTLGPASLVLFVSAIGSIGFFLYGPDALLTSAGAIDVGSHRRATLAAGIINGMGQIGAVVQEVALGRLIDKGNVLLVFGTLFGSSVLALVCLGILLLRNRAGKADL